MDKETQEKIETIINEAVVEGIYYPREPYADRAVEKIAQVLKGFRKLPEDKPLLLDCGDEHCQPHCHKAQRNSDIKHYEKEEK